MKAGFLAGGSGRRIAAIVAAVSAVGLAATACAAGQIAETAKETVVNDAAGNQLGSLYLRGVALQPPATFWSAGSDALLVAVIVNDGGSADQLVSVSSPVASSVSFEKSSARYLTTAPPAPSVSNPLTGSLASSESASVSPETTIPSVPGLTPAIPNNSPGPPPSSFSGTSPFTPSNLNSLAPSGTNSQLPTPGAALSGSPKSGSSLTINGHASLSIGYYPDNPAIVLHLTQDLYPAQPFKVTFTFAKAGSVTVDSLVKLDSSAPSPSVVPSLTATE